MKHQYTLLSLLLILFTACRKEAVNINVSDSNITPTKTVTTVVNPFSQLSLDAASNAIFTYSATSNPESKSRGWQGCPAFGIENDHYFTAWFANEKGEGPGSYIVVSESDDHGQTWQTNSLIIAPDDTDKRQMDPALWNDKYGYLHLSWTTTVGSWDGGAGGVWHVRIKKENGKIVITKPTRLFSGVMNVKPTFLRKDSSLLFPVSGWNIGTVFDGRASIPTPSAINGALLYKASYDPITKEVLTPTLYSRIPVEISKRNVDEHMVFTDAQDKNMWAILRTLTGITTSKSTDGGITWTAPEKYTDLGANTASRSYLGRLKSGNTVFIMNNAATRTNLTVFLSKDEGKTWPYKLVVEKTGDATYPDISQNKDGEICLAYDRGGRTVLGEVIFTKFTEQDIINGDASKIKKATVAKF